MPCPVCIDFENGIYHVYNRGVNKQSIFCDDDDRWYFIKLCKIANLKYSIEFLAFCLMGNHYHLFVHTPQANLSKVMKYIDERFSKYFIKKYKSDKKSGHTFMGPYGRRIVQTDRYASTLLAYIHNNPFKDRFVEHPADYKWSSYNYYENGKNDFGFINKATLESKFTPMPRDLNGKGIIDPYMANWDPDEHMLGNLILGDLEFAINIYQNHLQHKSCQKKLPVLNKFKQVIDSKTLRNFINSLDIDPYIYRNILIYSLLEWTELQSPQLENEFGIQAASIRRIKSIVNKKIKDEESSYLTIINTIKNEYALC